MFSFVLFCNSMPLLVYTLNVTPAIDSTGSVIINEAVKPFVIIRARTSYALSKRLDTRSDEVLAYLVKQALRLHNQSSLAALYGAYYD